MYGITHAVKIEEDRDVGYFGAGNFMTSLEADRFLNFE